MRLRMKSLRTLQEDTEKSEGKYRVLYAGICRTDAKMWDAGQRDLILPRVPGHEFVVADGEDNVFAVWPGIACGTCVYCRQGRENLCEDMAIFGFHRDGGFQSHIDLPRENLFPLRTGLPAYLGTLAEPLGCAIHGVDRLRIVTGEKVLILGGGTQGLLTSLILASRGIRVVVIDKDERKVVKAQEFRAKTGIEVRKQTDEGNFDCAINACASTLAFTQALTKLRKGGRLAYFSGLTKEQHITSDALNLAHYKEYEIQGAYGLTPGDTARAVRFIESHAATLELLIEKIIPPHGAQMHMPRILKGDVYRIIIDFNTASNSSRTPSPQRGGSVSSKKIT